MYLFLLAFLLQPLPGVTGHYFRTGNAWSIANHLFSPEFLGEHYRRYRRYRHFRLGSLAFGRTVVTTDSPPHQRATPAWSKWSRSGLARDTP